MTAPRSVLVLVRAAAGCRGSARFTLEVSSPAGAVVDLLSADLHGESAA